ncbi:NAD-dependent epimerase/dehydratase family protein [Saccharothrix coeruleofusca]|uniref:UDP-glucose 4-epimerase n=1 Tax=Saccharothrix coeruleofusca TaxID=33919 RepID=A0A918AHG7_9PSEU|nr:NAD-dependent epimerase/dehydratase family protein [Saccharothrix coeruleofusca]MBP2340179.1 UDP-glucose 4-epimerase [Saccharothrix coeruleofusca]GGP36876.1 UDP-glucose 4-epimerase GalE [Saccharothrix coeruleofusca]
MRVLVTGASGYVGRAVAAQLAFSGHEVVPFTGDVRDARAAEAAVRGADAVVHLAARARVRESFERPVEHYDVNVGGTLNLLRARPPVFLLASTAAVYGTSRTGVLTEDTPRDPASPYAASKAAAEDAVAWAARAGAVLRLFNVAGGGDRDDTRIVTRACEVAAGRLPSLEVYGDGSAVRDFVHVRDVARAFALVLERCREGHAVYNVGATPASVADVLGAVERVSGRPPAVRRRPAHPGEARVLRADTARLRALGWRPVESDLDELVRDQWASAASPPAG